MYDIIGDIHGYAAQLKALLEKLGYQEQSEGWSHPERKVIFLGDFVDRGPEQVEVVEIARGMVDSGNALAVMGNHEFNAVAYATPDPQAPGEYLRPHTPKNRKQHEDFLAQVVEGSTLHADMVAWFRALPLWLDLEGFRVVHACWHEEHMATLRPFLGEADTILPDAWPALTAEDTTPFEAVEVVLKGLEIPLPDGLFFHDTDGNKRTNIRTRWWKKSLTFRELAIAPTRVIESIPHEPVPEELVPGYHGDKPVFVGHYWMRGEPKPMSDKVACMDYSVAGEHGGKLCAYRWDGNAELSAERMNWVDRVV
ncbi:metallophosphoesterase [Haliea sp.]